MERTGGLKWSEEHYWRTLLKKWFDKPFDPLIVVSKVERLTILSMAEGQQLLAANMASRCAVSPFFLTVFSLKPIYLSSYIFVNTRMGRKRQGGK